MAINIDYHTITTSNHTHSLSTGGYIGNSYHYNGNLTWDNSYSYDYQIKETVIDYDEDGTPLVSDLITRKCHFCTRFEEQGIELIYTLLPSGDFGYMCEDERDCKMNTPLPIPIPETYPCHICGQTIGAFDQHICNYKKYDYPKNDFYEIRDSYIKQAKKQGWKPDNITKKKRFGRRTIY